MVVKTDTTSIQENHSVVKYFTIAANFKTDYSAPANSFELPARSRYELRRNLERQRSGALFGSLPRSIRCSFIWYFLVLIKKNTMFHLQINGEAIWKWREV